jgi:2-polyprenyl-6-methoxyphenol hydroxylase-like FAD-dependent oxidoreductase
MQVIDVDSHITVVKRLEGSAFRVDMLADGSHSLSSSTTLPSSLSLPTERFSVRVVLVGDAAHASSPMMGQGGCMAIEDAQVLAEELRAAATVESALASYVNRRRPRVEWVQHQSMAVEESLTMPSAARNAMLSEQGDQMVQTRFGPLVAPP